MIKRIKKILQQYPFYLFLLPVFFLLHNYLQYYGLVSAATALKVLLQTEIIFIASFFILKAFTKNFQRSAQIVSLFGCIVLFYGVIKDFFSNTMHFVFMAKYIVLLPVLLVLSLVFIIKISRKKDFRQSNLFQNTLFLLFLLVEAIVLVNSGTNVFRQQNRLVKSNILNPDTLPAVTGRPDIYFLVFDSYPGTTLLKDYLHYDNTPFDSILKSKGFYVAGRPQSNYNRTALSMAATLNFEYLQNIPDQSKLEPKHYNQASLSIETAVVPAVFIHNGYHIYNLSFFDLAMHPSMMKENFLVLPEEKMLLYNTLIERFRRDVLWNFIMLYGNLHISGQEKISQELFTKESIKKRDFNNRLIDSVQKIPLHDTLKPKFIYAHFYLPHPPFFYDRNGNSLNLNLADVAHSMEQKEAFISYLEYTNKIILKIVNTILINAPVKPVIVLQSDHGYRDFKKDFIKPEQYFRNYSSFYFPDGNYSMLYDTISNINTFPVIFNKYFKTNISLQKDVSVFTGY